MDYTKFFTFLACFYVYLIFNGTKFHYLIFYVLFCSAFLGFVLYRQ